MTIEDAEIEQLERELKALESTSQDTNNYGSPEPEKKDSMFKFFREILHLPESWKVSNLKDIEIGTSKLSVRSYLELARYAEAEDLDVVQKYFIARADIVAAPTMGRQGFMPQLFVTQIKKEQKIREPIKAKKTWFGANKDGEQ